MYLCAYVAVPMLCVFLLAVNEENKGVDFSPVVLAVGVLPCVPLSLGALACLERAAVRGIPFSPRE